MGELLTRIMAMIENLLIAPIVWIFPIKWAIVIPGWSAIRFTFGKPSKNLESGIHFGTTGQTIEKRHTQTNLGIAESMYVLTEDGLSVRIRGVVIYRITNLMKYLTFTEDSDQFMIEACEAAIRHIVSTVPFDDLVSDSDTVEEAIGSKITEICKELGIRIKRYRFQDIEITDPIGRALSSIRAMSPRLTSSAEEMSQRLGISTKDALVVLSPNIQFVANILNVDPRETEFIQEETDES